jgi:hypothetical protein
VLIRTGQHYDAHVGCLFANLELPDTDVQPPCRARALQPRSRDHAPRARLASQGPIVVVWAT